MYYNEKVINGILCYKTHPNGDWHEYSKESLTIMLNGERERVNALKQFISEVRPKDAETLELQNDDLKDINI